MWNITSSDVQNAKEEIERRHAEIERRYAEETQELDAERAVIETLERAASAFALKHGREEPASGPPSQAAALPEPADAAGDENAAEAPPAEPDPDSGGDAAAGNLDILKPGSRWRLYRGSRAGEAEDAASATFPRAG
jgi:hypothetical protein